MVDNTGLSNAKNARKDEFYTAYEDIQIGINHYEDKFKGDRFALSIHCCNTHKRYLHT